MVGFRFWLRVDAANQAQSRARAGIERYRNSRMSVSEPIDRLAIRPKATRKEQEEPGLFLLMFIVPALRHLYDQPPPPMLRDRDVTLTGNFRAVESCFPPIRTNYLNNSVYSQC